MSSPHQGEQHAEGELKGHGNSQHNFIIMTFKETVGGWVKNTKKTLNTDHTDRQRLRGESKPKASKEGRQEKREMGQRLNETGK